MNDKNTLIDGRETVICANCVKTVIEGERDREGWARGRKKSCTDKSCLQERECFFSYSKAGKDE